MVEFECLVLYDKCLCSTRRIEQKIFMAYIYSFMASSSGMYIIFGDFNVSRYPDERLGTLFNSVEASHFNDFISSNDLFDVPMGGHKFTRLSSNGEKLSKLDLFLISDELATHLHSMDALVLYNKIADHRPILFRQQVVDYGPTPFKFFNSWITIDGFRSLVENFWNNPDINFSQNAMVRLKQKLKGLKGLIKDWNKVRYKEKNAVYRELAAKLNVIDAS